MQVEADGEVRIGMANSNSVWSGVLTELGSNGVLGLDISNGAKWVLYNYDQGFSLASRDSSSVTELNLHNGGVVDLSAQAFSEVRLLMPILTIGSMDTRTVPLKQ